MDLDNYDEIWFDCDGVIFDSNHIKTKSFELALGKYPKKDIEQFLKYHKDNGGVSRNVKFDHFFSQILQLNNYEKELKIALDNFSLIVKKELIKCNMANNLDIFRKRNNANWRIISGGNEQELRLIFQLRKIHKFFNGGIYGSPKNKYEIVRSFKPFSILKNKKILFIGDSKLDYEVAKFFKVDFIFISQWTEFNGWKVFCVENNILNHHSLDELFHLE